MRPIKAEHANATAPYDPTRSMMLRDDSQQGKINDNRPQTASRKGSYVVPPIGKEGFHENDLQHQPNIPSSVVLEAKANAKGGDYFDPQPRSERDVGQYRGKVPDKSRPRENGRRGARIDQLKPMSKGRHSEDNRARPSLPLDTGMDVGYERSRTMPTTLSEVALRSGRQPDLSAWQEPGFVAGYHGPQDRGYTPTSTVSEFRQGSFTQFHAYSDEGRPGHVDTSVHAQKDSLGEFFDTYYSATRDDHHPYLYGKDRQHQIPSNVDISINDDGLVSSSDSTRHETTIDNHLRPQPRCQGFLPTPLHPREDVRRDYRHDSSSAVRHPRSKSQPNNKEHRSPRPPLNHGFDFGVPGAPNRPPATAAARNEYASCANSTLTSSSTRLNQYQQDRQYQGEHVSENEYRYYDHSMANRLSPMQSERPLQVGPPCDRPSPPVNDRPRPTPAPTASPPNPDALPSHPTPIRPGLIQSAPVNQAPKPVPLRQYNSTASTTQSSSPTKAPGPSRSMNTKRESVPVTHQELERLKQATTRNPEDQKAQLLLAKKLVEAASILIDERTDPRTRNKSREKYILEAHKIVKRLSNNGYSEANFYLADAYSRGSLGLESDTREAFKLYQSAAKAGHAQAAYRVAVCCEIGHEEGGGTSRDAVKAMQWYKRAATLGDTPAMYKMGIISLKGLLGQPKNPKEAIVWLKRAAERADVENPHALHELVSLPIRVKTVGHGEG